MAGTIKVLLAKAVSRVVTGLENYFYVNMFTVVQLIN
jgi:hypothetical protein